jgi:biofilm protein TabA
MIYDHLSHQQLYRTVTPGLEKAFDYLLNFDESTPDGRYELDGELLVAMVQTYETQPAAEKRYESHERYLDVQYIVSGEEILYHTPVNRLEISTPYSQAKDVMFFADPPATSAEAAATGWENPAVLMRAGDFCVLYPQDGHKPSCTPPSAKAAVKVKKVVMKVQV